MAKDTNKSPFDEKMFNPFKNVDTSKLKNAMPSLEAHLEMMKALQKISLETFQALMKIQNDYLKDLAQEWTEQTKLNVSSAPLAEKSQTQVKALKDTAEKTKEHFKDVSAVIEKSQKQVLEKLKAGPSAQKAPAKKAAAKKAPAKKAASKKPVRGKKA